MTGLFQAEAEEKIRKAEGMAEEINIEVEEKIRKADEKAEEIKNEAEEKIRKKDIEVEQKIRKKEIEFEEILAFLKRKGLDQEYDQEIKLKKLKKN